jgi:predicted dehydrogenase
MNMRLAFVGFRHGHIFDLYRRASVMEGIDVVAACECDKATREQIMAQGSVDITHDNFDDMLKSVACDAVAVGDYFTRRGSLIIQALSHGKHIISDKPLCTSLDELDEIEKLSAAKALKLNCMLDMRDSAPFITVRKLIRQGTIGEIHAISFNGQHPLLLGKRPSWYFEPGKHGGTINDIAIHAIDAIPWITGLHFKSVNAARCWNAFAAEYPHFEDAGQMMLTMNNGCGVLGDVSYMAPDSSGYTLPFYWRITFWGRNGVIETANTAREVVVARNGEKGLHREPLAAGNPGGYLRSFIHDVEGHLDREELCTESVLHGARIALSIQKAADTHTCNVSLAQ